MEAQDQSYILWVGQVAVPQRLVLSITLDNVDLLVTPVSTLRYSLFLCNITGDEIVACKRCMQNRITDIISYSTLMLTSKVGRAHVDCDVCVMCDGSESHDTGDDRMLVLHIY